ncbi:hypothetical protein ACTVZO_40285 [Streptomyces sp. IBSNAI002]|uniref:hypothetical protein n=1 Tax=Streptomyces sp. IBSNAI002 TaxID=3457500 RepID=UPI003FD118E9
MTTSPHPQQSQAKANEETGEQVLAAALRAAVDAGAVGIDLFSDGFEISGPDDISLYRSAHTFTARTPAALAGYLGIPENAVQDARR